jgi:hypothetical protein
MLAVHREVAFGDVQVGAADPARVHSHQQLGRVRPRHLGFDVFEWARVHRAGRAHPPRAHRRGGRVWSHHSIMPRFVVG